MQQISQKGAIMEYLGVSALQALPVGKLEKALESLFDGRSLFVSTMTKLITIEDVCRKCIRTNLIAELGDEALEYIMNDIDLRTEIELHNQWRSFWERG